MTPPSCGFHFQVGSSGYLSGRHLRDGMFGRLVAALRDDRAVVHECRHCGTTVEPSTVGCPACESGDIARYEL